MISGLKVCIFTFLGLFSCYVGALSQHEIDKLMREMASAQSSHLPIDVDGRTVWVNTGYIDGELHHTYKLKGIGSEHLRDKGRLAQAEQALTEEKQNLYCSHPEMAVFRKYGIPVVYNYVTESGLFIVRAIVTERNC